MDPKEIRKKYAELSEEKILAENVVTRATAEIQALRELCKHPEIGERSTSRTIEPEVCPHCGATVYLSVVGRA